MHSPNRRPRLRAIPSLLILLGAIAVGMPASVLSATPAAATNLVPGGSGSSTILPGVHVGRVDLSDLDETAARQALMAGFSSVRQGQVNVIADGAATAIPYASFNRRIDLDRAIASAFSVGRTGNPFQQLMEAVRTVTAGTTLQPAILFDEAALTQAVAQVASSAARPGVNARTTWTSTGFGTAAAKMGRAFDATAALPPLIAQLYDPSAPASIRVALSGRDVQPDVTDAAAQTARATADAMALPLVLANGGQTWTIPGDVVHSWINFRVVEGVGIQISFSDALIQTSLAALVDEIHRDPVPASLAFESDSVTVVPSKDGRDLDVVRTARRIQLFLEGRGSGTIPPDKKLGPTVIYPKASLTTEQAQAQASQLQLLSTWTTSFQPAAHNGNGANIWVPAGYLDNQVVQPGETFSFWDRVGEVSLARGYRMGGAIINGRTQEGVALAGGICSTSTTMFNAALRAGFKMGERSNHYYFIKRYPVGLDATVSKTSGGQQDMTWTNDTPYPVLIKSFKTSGSATFSLFGVPTGRTVTFSTPIITKYVQATSEVVLVATLPTGRLVRIEYPDDGFNASVTRFVRDANGMLIDQRTFISRYSMVRGIEYKGDPAGKNISVPSYAPGAQGG